MEFRGGWGRGEGLASVRRRNTSYYGSIRMAATAGGAKEAVTVRLDAERRAELDAVAQAMSRDRSYVVNEATASYLAGHRWQVAHIAEGLRQGGSR